MSADYFDRLEAELRAAVPRAADGPAGSPDWRPRWRPRSGGLAVAISMAVTIAVVVLSVSLAGHRQTPARPPLLHHRGPGPGGFQFPLGAVATRSQLLENFAVLRRPQTARDRWDPHCSCAGSARQLNGFTRLATTLPSGYRVYLDLEQFIAPGQLNMAAGSYVLNLDVVDPHGSSSSAAFGPNVGFTVSPISSGGNDSVWTSLVPDGVARVRWTFECRAGRRTASGCSEIRPRTFTVPVVNNVAARQVANSGNCPSCASPQHITWYSAGGRPVASFNLGLNLAAPPFVKGGRGYRLLRVLRPTAIGAARLGAPSSTATRTIERLLGPPADANVPTGGCGIDHESVWTSPTVAEPLTIFERRGHFVGYRYGAPVQEIGLLRGPGAVLATDRGLTLAKTVAVARRLYGTSLVTSAARGGSWRVRTEGGTLHGSVLPTIYPLRVVTARNPVATIGAGLTGCPAGGA